jgi:hypothetical protein
MASKLAVTRDTITDGLQRLLEKLRTLKRTKQEGRIPLPAVACRKFCYHSLKRIPTYYHIKSNPDKFLCIDAILVSATSPE